MTPSKKFRSSAKVSPIKKSTSPRKKKSPSTFPPSARKLRSNPSKSAKVKDADPAAEVVLSRPSKAKSALRKPRSRAGAPSLVNVAMLEDSPMSEDAPMPEDVPSLGVDTKSSPASSEHEPSLHSSWEGSSIFGTTPLFGALEVKDSLGLLVKGVDFIEFVGFHQTAFKCVSISSWGVSNDGRSNSMGLA